jgi:hypothetical protein
MNMKRMRGRNHRPNGGGGGGGGGGFSRNQQNGIPLNRNHVFDSSGPEMRVRGTAQQLYEKYQQLARDASGNGDRVLGEAYYQHAEHYFRIISAINQAQGQPNGQQNGQSQERGNYQPQQNGSQIQDRGDYPRRDYQNEPAEAPAEPPRQQEQPRRYEPRQFEPRQKPEFQRPEREPRYRPEPVVDARIDISSALEAELAAATAGLAEQPEIPVMKPAPEPRAIPIVPDAPPPPEAPVLKLEAPAPRVAKPRGRPRVVKTEKVAE